MRALEEKGLLAGRQGIPYEVHTHTCKLYTAEGVAEDLSIPVAQVVKAGQGHGVRCSDRSFVLVVIPGDKRLSLKKLGAVLKDKGLEFGPRTE